SQGRSDATARGGVYCVREALKHLKLDTNKSTYAIQGFGNAGQHAATLHKQILGGGRLIAVSDSGGGIVSDDGINPEGLVKYKLETGKVAGFPGSKPITNEALLELKVDILYPAALENAITDKNAGNIKAKIL